MNDKAIKQAIQIFVYFKQRTYLTLESKLLLKFYGQCMRLFFSKHYLIKLIKIFFRSSEIRIKISL